MATTSEHVDLRTDLIRLVTSRLLDPLEILLPQADLVGLRSSVEADAEMWAAQLLGPDDALARQVAVRLMCVLHPGDTPFDPPESWWATPLGRVTARRAGHPSKDHVSLGVAGAMLGITRQGVHDLVNRNKLLRHPDGGVTVDSIRARLGLRREL
ncbi:hypothetical protein SAMN04488564_113142 [Lentzea waywayandensis]|uniref:MftR C-terminal domain-containing protein n=1 Tax=Lentzea waywayandensis TaxID=84724 RepID=A0A1I6FEH1_9PSEU|nr:hypothetical protein [Lentzea waywayandensis]SFR28294.1 hypothetical protein SAMN04488564_113142 [Lentzea waywayandensis]